MVKPVTFKRGTISIATRQNGTNKRQDVTGLVSDTGIGIHKGIDRGDYVIMHLHSGRAITYARTQTEAKQKAERIAQTTNWKKKEIKPSRDLAEKIQYAERGEKRPRKRNKKLDEYDLKAHARDKSGNLVEHEKATGYKGQKAERRYIKRELHAKHIGYRINVTNETKGRRVK